MSFAVTSVHSAAGLRSAPAAARRGKAAAAVKCQHTPPGQGGAKSGKGLSKRVLLGASVGLLAGVGRAAAAWAVDDDEKQFYANYSGAPEAEPTDLVQVRILKNIYQTKCHVDVSINPRRRRSDTWGASAGGGWLESFASRTKHDPKVLFRFYSATCKGGKGVTRDSPKDYKRFTECIGT